MWQIAFPVRRRYIVLNNYVLNIGHENCFLTSVGLLKGCLYTVKLNLTQVPLHFEYKTLLLYDILEEIV